jgi:hypothetical protein
MHGDTSMRGNRRSIDLNDDPLAETSLGTPSRARCRSNQSLRQLPHLVEGTRLFVRRGKPDEKRALIRMRKCRRMREDGKA